MRRSLALLTLLIFPLSGCASMFGADTVTKVFDDTGAVVTTISGTAAQRDQIYASAMENRDTMTKEMYESSGAEVVMGEFTEISPGIFVQTVKSIRVREAPKFQQNLATTPPDHRGWKSLDNAVDKAFFGFGAWTIGNAFSDAVSNDSVDYGSSTFQSYNPVSTVEPSVITPTL